MAALGLDGALAVMAAAPLLLASFALPALFAVDRQTATASAALAPRVALLEQLGMFAYASGSASMNTLTASAASPPGR